MAGLSDQGRLTVHGRHRGGLQERNRRLLERLSKDEPEMLLGYIDRLTETAAQLLAARKDQRWRI
jgi:hypothetical protein